MSVGDRALAIANKKRHDELCREIAKDLPTFIRVGSRLKELQQIEVYKETHKTFEAFVLAEFGLSRTRAYQLIDASDTTESLSKILDKTEVPKIESQLLEVAKAPQKKQAEVVKKVAEVAAKENRKPTAKDYKKVVAELIYEDVEDNEAGDTPADKAPIPAHHPKEMAGPLMAHVSTLTKMLNDLKKRAEDRGGEWIDMQAIGMQISALKYSVKSSIYYADCPACGGKRCARCKQSGFLPELKKAVVEGDK